MLSRMLRMFGGMDMVTMSKMGMVGSRLVVTILMVLGGFVVMARSVLVVLGSLLVMFGRFV